MQIQMASTCSCSVRHGGQNRICDIKVTQSELGADICNNILFMHAILGCNTTSRYYGLVKGLSPKRFTSNALSRDKAEQFCKKDATVDDVIDAGEAALVCLYSGKEGDNIDGLNRLTSNALFRDKAEQFCKKDATVDDVIDAGEAALVCLYSGKEGDNLDGLWYAKCCDKVASSTNKVHIRPHTLPPTSAAARYHSMRVYLRVQQWLGVCNMKKTYWG